MKILLEQIREIRNVVEYNLSIKRLAFLYSSNSQLDWNFLILFIVLNKNQTT